VTSGDIHLKLDSYSHGFSRRNRLLRLLWKVVQSTAFRLSPPFAHGFRRALLRMFGARIDATALIYPTVNVWAPWNLEMGPHSCISWGVDCYCVDMIRLGQQALVSQNARLVTASHAITSPDFRLIHKPIELASECWVCAFAYVGMGVTVGRGAVVAATATVVKDVEPWAIVGGNPARRIGTRSIDEATP
jgi:putative colanic acid biosynthesis acetyltransferase WcaF